VELRKTTAAGAQAVPGQSIEYTITATNLTAGTTVPSYTFYDPVPTYTTLIGVTASAGVDISSNCASASTAAPVAAGTVCTFTVTDLANGTPATVTYTVLVDADLPVTEATVVNKAYGPTECDDTPANPCNPIPNCDNYPNDPSCTPIPTDHPIVLLEKTVDVSQTRSGAVISYTITAHDVVAGTVVPAHYTFIDVVPANAELIGFAVVAPSAAAASISSNCASASPATPVAAGTECMITSNTTIPSTTPEAVTLTVRIVSALPRATAYIVNQAYYVTLPDQCSLNNPLNRCNPVEPSNCTGDACTPPVICAAGDPACVETPIQQDEPLTPPTPVPTLDALGMLLLALMLGASGLLLRRREGRRE
jgi:hypothetical protein